MSPFSFFLFTQLRITGIKRTKSSQLSENKLKIRNIKTLFKKCVSLYSKLIKNKAIFEK